MIDRSIPRILRYGHELGDRDQRPRRCANWKRQRLFESLAIRGCQFKTHGDRVAFASGMCKRRIQTTESGGECLGHRNLRYAEQGGFGSIERYRVAGRQRWQGVVGIDNIGR